MPELIALDTGSSSGSVAMRSEPQSLEIGNGTLILVVGPSGAGKDTLLAEARRHFSGNRDVMFCERIITRSGDIGEKHVHATDTEFQRMVDAGGFFLHWDAHELRYGIPAGMLDELRAGRTVIANVSRRVLGEAQKKWPNTIILNVTARKDVLRKRLLGRGRESAEFIDKRLERAFSVALPDEGRIEEIDNSGALQPAARRMIAIIASTLDARQG